MRTRLFDLWRCVAANDNRSGPSEPPWELEGTALAEVPGRVRVAALHPPRTRGQFAAALRGRFGNEVECRSTSLRAAESDCAVRLVALSLNVFPRYVHAVCSLG